MQRTLILIVVFLFSLSLVTLAYSQSSIEQTLSSPVLNSAVGGCVAGSQLASTVNSADVQNLENAPDHCGKYSAFVQGACGCDMASGKLLNTGNPVCRDALKNK